VTLVEVPQGRFLKQCNVLDCGRLRTHAPHDRIPARADRWGALSYSIGLNQLINMAVTFVGRVVCGRSMKVLDL
jgi:hypothetical protein